MREDWAEELGKRSTSLWDGEGVERGGRRGVGRERKVVGVGRRKQRQQRRRGCGGGDMTTIGGCLEEKGDKEGEERRKVKSGLQPPGLAKMFKRTHNQMTSQFCGK